MDAAEPLIHWPQPIRELIGFLAAFCAAGAVGFRWGVLARLPTPPIGALFRDEMSLRNDAAARAALVGLAGEVVTAVFLGINLAAGAARRHLTVGGLLAADRSTLAGVILLALALLGFALAAARWRPGWILAAAGVIAGALRAALFGQWERLVNPVHELAGGLWIGTLFVMVAVGLTAVMRGPLPGPRRGVVAAEMVRAFSPVALGSAATLALFGLLTAWIHLKVLRALWTTPYGIALIVKLCAVAGVLGLGAFNWRRQRPRMGTEAGAVALRGTATAELLAALVVLLVTAVLVSLPDPKVP